MSKPCFHCDRNLVPTDAQMNNSLYWCGGEAVCVCDSYANEGDFACPNCGGIDYPCPCGGDGLMPDDGTTNEYQEYLDCIDDGLNLPALACA